MALPLKPYTGASDARETREGGRPLAARLPSFFRRPSSSPGALMLLVFGLYLLLMSGHTYSPDEETMLQVSRGLVEAGTWEMEPNTTLVQVPGSNGRTFSQYGPGQSLAAVPWVALGLVVGPLFPPDQAEFVLRLVLGSFNALVGAGIAALFAALGLRLGYSRRASIFLAGALAFATYLWPHSRTFFSELLVALLLLASFYLLVGPAPLFTAPLAGHTDTTKERRRSTLRLLISGAIFAAAVATKVQYAVAIPAFLLYLTLAPGRQTTDGTDDNSKLPPLLLWLGGLTLGLLPLFLHNLLAFGNPLSTGYGSDLAATFRTPLYEGLFGLLLSPGKGLFWYALPVLISVWGFARFCIAHRSVALFILALAIPILVLFSLYTFWHGDGSWGPRYLVPLLPFALLPALPLVDKHKDQRPETRDPYSPLTARHSPLAHSLLISTLIGLGFLVNALGVLVNFDTYINLGYDDEARHYLPYASPIVGHWNMAGRQAGDLAALVTKQSRTLLIRRGFSYSEGDKTKGELLPRWTTGQGEIEIRPVAGTDPLSATLRLADHRPPELPRAVVSILVDGDPVTVSPAPVPDQPVSIDYSFPLKGQASTITIKSDTWKPSETQEGGRDESIGVLLERVLIYEGGKPQTYRLIDTLPAPAYYARPRWYYDPATPHASDLWFTYMSETGMGRRAMLALSLPIVAVGLASVLLGLRGLKRSGRTQSEVPHESRVEVSDG